MQAYDNLDTQFYPTPPALAARAWAKFKNRNFVRILEPQAGNGDLAQARPDWDRYSGRPAIDCCEIDISKHALLRAKGLNVVGIDFLRFGNGSFYSHIICYPPFAEGATHVLKSWDILWDGEIVAILNAETVRNPFSQERQRLVRLIEQFGEFEFVEGAFAGPQAQRRTDVEVALVYLRKQADLKRDIIGEVLDELCGDGKGNHGMEATCIGCGCTDTCACYDEQTDRACHWERVDYGVGLGVCYCCKQWVRAWDGGKRIGAGFDRQM